jgi:hypothetical protein
MNQKASPSGSAFHENHLKELQERFGRLIKKMGPINKKGTLRYNYEVEFMYSLNEIRLCPPYLQGKMFENASNVVSSLVNLIQLKQQSDDRHLEV